MAVFQPTGIQLHLVTGNKRMFYQEDEELVAKICADLDGRIFTRQSLILEGMQDVTAIPGHALIGITVLTTPIPDSFYENERLSKTVVTQISEETYQLRRLQAMPKVEGERSALFSELEFASRERLFLEFSEIAVSGMDERNVLHHLFSKPSLSCRRFEGGFSIWNTAHIVSWSYHPKLEVPSDAWQADSLADPSKGDAKIVNMAVNQ